MASPVQGKKEGSCVRVAVVGLAGAGNAACGVGKSCLCNRFVRSAEDEFCENHSSAISPSDFYGAVLNGQHFLYWGQVRKYPNSRPSPDLSAQQGKKSYDFHVVEHTEFVDDSTFKTLSGAAESGISAYVRRVGKTKLTTAGKKLAYINRDQLGDVAVDGAAVNESSATLFPSPFEVDAFLVAVDVSRSLPAQSKWLERLLPAIVKLKRPFVIAACKCDAARPACMEELEALVKRCAKGTPIVETSARNAVNVDAAFLALASAVRRTNGRLHGGQSPRGGAAAESYADALGEVRSERARLTGQFCTVLEREVHDFQVTWPQVEARLGARDELQQLVRLEGREAARRAVIAHVRALREARRATLHGIYEVRLRWAFAALLPAVNINTRFENALDTVREHSAMLEYFSRSDEALAWDSKELLALPPASGRVPLDFLDDEVTTRHCFEEHVEGVEVARRNSALARDLRSALDEWKSDMTPGMSWSSASSVLRSLGKLPDANMKDSFKQQVFSQFDADLRLECCQEFYDSLLENIEVLDSSSHSGATPSSDQLKKIEYSLKGTPTYDRLRKCINERSLVLMNLLAEKQRPPLHEDVSRCIAQLPTASKLLVAEREWELCPEGTEMLVVLIGATNDTSSVVEAVKESVRRGEMPAAQLPHRMVCLEPANTASTLLPSSKLVGKPHGLLGVVKGLDCLERVEKALLRLLLPDPSSPPGSAEAVYRGLPLVLVQIRDPVMCNESRKLLKKGISALAAKLQCPLVKVICPEGNGAFVSYAASAIVLLRSVVDKHYNALHYGDAVSEDIRVAVCVLADDKLNTSQILAPLFSQQFCWKVAVSPSAPRKEVFRSLVCLENRIKMLELRLFSTMNPNILLQSPHHGYLLLHSALRVASAHLAHVLLTKLPTVMPRLVVVGTQGSDMPDDSELDLLDSTDRLAMECGAQTLLATPDFAQQDAPFRAFLHEAWERRSDIPAATHGPSHGARNSYVVTEGSGNKKQVHTPDLSDIQHRRNNNSSLYSLVGSLGKRAMSSDNLATATAQPLVQSGDERLSANSRRSRTPDVPRSVRSASPMFVAKRNSASHVFAISGRSHVYDNVTPVSATAGAAGATAGAGAGGGMVKSASDDGRLRLPPAPTTVAPATASSASSASTTTTTTMTTPHGQSQAVARRVLPPTGSPRHHSVPIMTNHPGAAATAAAVADHSESLGQSSEDDAKLGRQPPRRWTADNKRPAVLPKPKAKRLRPDSTDSVSLDDPTVKPLAAMAVAAEAAVAAAAASAMRKATEGHRFLEKNLEKEPAPPTMTKPAVGTARTAACTNWYTTPPQARKHGDDGRTTAGTSPPSSLANAEVDVVRRPPQGQQASSNLTSPTRTTAPLSNPSPLYEDIASARGTKANAAATTTTTTTTTAERPKLRSSPTFYETVDDEPPPPPTRVESRDAHPVSNGATGGHSRRPPGASPSHARGASSSPDIIRASFIKGAGGSDDGTLVLVGPGLYEDYATAEELLERMHPDSDTSTSSTEEGPPLPPRLYLASDSGNDSEEFDKVGTLGDSSEASGQHGNEWNHIMRLSRSRMSMHSELLSKHQRKELRKQRDKRRKQEVKELREQEKKERLEQRQKKKDQQKESRARKKAQKDAKSKGDWKAYQPDGPGPGPTYFGLYLHDLPEREDGSKIPLFVEMCIHHIEEHGLYSSGIYRVSGKKDLVDRLQAQFASNPSGTRVDTDLMNVNVAASALKSFFRRLPEPLIPTQILSQLSKSLAADDLERQLKTIKMLINAGVPSMHLAVLKYLCRHLNKVAAYHETNLMLCSNLSIVFWPTLMRPESLNINDFTNAQEMPLTLQRVMTLLIDRYHMIFDDRSPPPVAAAERSAVATAPAAPSVIMMEEDGQENADGGGGGGGVVSPYVAVNVSLTPLPQRKPVS